MQGLALAEYARGQCRLVVAPPLTDQGGNDLLARKAAAGHQKGKARGTIQSNKLDEFRRKACISSAELDAMEDVLGDDLGEWIESMIDMAAGEQGVVINYFLNFNKGDPPAGVDDPFHEDHPTSPEINTGRVLFYHMSEGQLASLKVRDGEAEVERTVERWPLGSATIGSPAGFTVLPGYGAALSTQRA